MHKLLLAILISFNAYANDGRHIALSGAAPLAVTYTTDARGLVASELFSMKTFTLVNYTQSPIACLFVKGDPQNILITNTAPATPPTGREGNEIFIAASEHFIARDFYPSENLFCRGENTQVVSGDLFFNAW